MCQSWRTPRQTRFHTICLPHRSQSHTHPIIHTRICPQGTRQRDTNYWESRSSRNLYPLGSPSFAGGTLSWLLRSTGSLHSSTKDTQSHIQGVSGHKSGHNLQPFHVRVKCVFRIVFCLNLKLQNCQRSENLQITFFCSITKVLSFKSKGCWQLKHSFM